MTNLPSQVDKGTAETGVGGKNYWLWRLLFTIGIAPPQVADFRPKLETQYHTCAIFLRSPGYKDPKDNVPGCKTCKYKYTNTNKQIQIQIQFRSKRMSKKEAGEGE